MHFLLRCISILSLFLQVIAEPKSTAHHDPAVYGGKHGLNTHSLSAQQLLNKGIAALGGRAKLEALHGVSSHA